MHIWYNYMKKFTFLFTYLMFKLSILEESEFVLPCQVASIDVAEIHLRAQVTQLHLRSLKRYFLS